MSRRIAALVAVYILFLAGLAWGQTGGTSWDRLKPEEQKTLQPFKERWNSMTPDRQERLRNGVERWRHMNPDERRATEERYKRWEKLPPEQRQDARQKIRSMTPDEKSNYFKGKNR